MDASTLAALLASLTPAAPLCDYYGRELLPDDVVRAEPWSMLGFPAELAGVTLTVVGQTGDGMLVVSPHDDLDVRFRIWPETVSVVRRDGADVQVPAQSWWGTLLAAQTPGQPLTACGALPGLPGGVDTPAGLLEGLNGDSGRAL